MSLLLWQLPRRDQSVSTEVQEVNQLVKPGILGIFSDSSELEFFRTDSICSNTVRQIISVSP